MTPKTHVRNVRTSKNLQRQFPIYMTILAKFLKALTTMPIGNCGLPAQCENALHEEIYQLLRLTGITYHTSTDVYVRDRWPPEAYDP